MAKQKLYVKGIEVQLAMHPAKKALIFIGVMMWSVFCIFSFVTLKDQIRTNSNSINGLLSGKNREFLQILSQRESGGDWKIVGGYNDAYIGLYQFGNSALRDIDSNVRVKAFKKNRDVFPPLEQHKACIALMRNNKRYLKNHYKYIGKTINGVKINEAGLLASAHLVGHGAVKKWLESNGKNEGKDGFGTSLVEYMKLMKGVHIEL